VKVQAVRKLFLLQIFMDLKRSAFVMLYGHFNRLPVLTHLHTTQSQPKHTYSANASVINNVIV